MFQKTLSIVYILTHLQTSVYGQEMSRDNHQCIIEHSTGDSVQDHLPAYASHLQNIVIEHKNIPIIMTDDLANLEARSLVLRDNNIEGISVYAFNTSSIKNLDLSNNLIKCIFEDQLKIPNLEQLSLEKNRILYIEKNALPETLTILNLKFNQLTQLEPPSNVQELLVSKNKLTNLDLSKARELKKLHLDFNALEHFDFSGLNHLTYLNLSSNNLRKLDKKQFINLENLFELDLSNNGLRNIEILENVFPKLGVLKLNDNQIKTIENNILQEIKTLMELDVSGNELEYFNFTDLRKVWRLKMNNIKLKSLEPEKFFNMHTLYEIELSNNLLSTFNPNLNIPTVWRLDLSHNNIKNIDNNFGNFKELGSLDLSYNNMESLTVASNNLDKIWKIKLNNNKLREIPDENIPNLNFLLLFDLSNNNLKTFKISSHKLRRLRVLDISFNSFSVYDEDLVSSLQGIRFLNLRNNFISEIAPSNFYAQNKLYYLDLSYNLITSLKYNNKDVRSTLRTFNIFGNPLNCLHLKEIENFCQRNFILMNTCDSNTSGDGRTPICVDYKCDCEFIYNELTENYLKTVPKLNLSNCSFSVLAHNGA